MQIPSHVSYGVYLQEFITVLLTNRGLSKNTAMSYERDLKQWLLFCEQQNFPIRTLDKIDKSMLDCYFHYLSDQGFATTTINRKISALRTFFRFLQRHGYITTNPMQNVDRPKGMKSIPRNIPVKTAQELLAQPTAPDSFRQTRDRCLLEILYATGVRVSELVAIGYPPLISGQSTLLIRGKGNKERIVAIHERCKQFLALYLVQRQKYLQKRHSPWLFFTTHDISRHISRQSCNNILRHWSTKAGLPSHIYPHLVRHTVASHLLHNGMNLGYLQYFLGHSSIDTVQIYTHVLPDNLVQVMNRHPLQKTQESGQSIPQEASDEEANEEANKIDQLQPKMTEDYDATE